MPGKHNAGGCGCCGGACTCCTDYTAVTVSGMVQAACSSGCDARNGTWVYRNISDPYVPVGTACPAKTLIGWAFNDNCGGAAKYVGQQCGSGNNDAAISFSCPSPGLVKVSISLVLVYTLEAFLPAARQARYQGVWEDTQSDCSLLSPTLVSSTITISAAGGVCGLTGNDTGDYCNLLGATVGLA